MKKIIKKMLPVPEIAGAITLDKWLMCFSAAPFLRLASSGEWRRGAPFAPNLTDFCSSSLHSDREHPHQPPAQKIPIYSWLHPLEQQMTRWLATGHPIKSHEWAKRRVAHKCAMPILKISAFKYLYEVFILRKFGHKIRISIYYIRYLCLEFLLND